MTAKPRDARTLELLREARLRVSGWTIYSVPTRAFPKGVPRGGLEWRDWEDEVDALIAELEGR